MSFGAEKLEWCGYPTEKNDDMFIRFNKIHARDGHTHKQTPHDDIRRACIASRGNKAPRSCSTVVNKPSVGLL